MSSEEQGLQCALYSTLKVKRTDSRDVQVVAAFYGSPGSKQTRSKSSLIPSQLQIFSEGHKPGTSVQAPKQSISLQAAQVSILKPSSRRRRTEQDDQTFCVTTKESDCYEFRASSEKECQLWINIVKFLITFPHSSLPQEPLSDCSQLDFDEVLNPMTYRADSAWPTYVAPGEVGSRSGVTGPMVLALKGRVFNTMGKMELYSPFDHTYPILSYKHDMVRCTGKMGKFLYVELGSRCKGGPGLLWMYFGSKERANTMKEVFYLFLVKQQVAAPFQPLPPQDLLPPCSSSPPVPPRGWTSPTRPTAHFVKHPSSPRLPSAESRSRSAAKLIHRSSSPKLVPRRSRAQTSHTPTPSPKLCSKSMSSPLIPVYPKSVQAFPNSSLDIVDEAQTPPPLPPRRYLTKDGEPLTQESGRCRQKEHNYDVLEVDKNGPKGTHTHLESLTLESNRSSQKHHHYDILELERNSPEGTCTYLEPQQKFTAAGEIGKGHDYHILESKNFTTYSLKS